MCLRSLQPLFRAVAVLLGTLVVPAISVSHGVAHHREAHHDASPHHLRPFESHPSFVTSEDRSTHAAVEREPSSAPETWAFHDAEPHDGHADAAMDAGLRARADWSVAAPLASQRVVIDGDHIVAAHVRTTHAALPRADPATGPPPRLRAPPTV